MRIAFLFPGQGSQYVGMGADLYKALPVVRETFDEADRILGMALSDLCFNGPKEELQKTVNTQPAVLTTSIACYRVLLERGIRPDAVAGHSLGEYSALVAAGAIRLSDAVPLVRLRGQLMQDAVPLGTGGMMAVLGLDEQRLEEVRREASAFGLIEMANFNCPGQIVLAGETPALEQAVKLAKQAGAKRSVLLAVSGPFHSSLMRGAGERLAEVLENVEINTPSVPVVANVNASLLQDANQVRAALVRQIYSPVRWTDCVQRLLDNGMDAFIEVGPGKVLCGLVKKIANRDILLLNVEDLDSLEKSVARLQEVV
ncbi:MAG: ACP S-malonyltransferase [Bacillota bacterium]